MPLPGLDREDNRFRLPSVAIVEVDPPVDALPGLRPSCLQPVERPPLKLVRVGDAASASASGTVKEFSGPEAGVWFSVYANTTSVTGRIYVRIGLFSCFLTLSRKGLDLTLTLPPIRACMGDVCPTIR